jgi:glycosyltransferase involved in cell wall biosynthesis
VVSTDCPSGPAEILEDGTYGALVPVGDERAMAAAIADTIAKPPPQDLLRERADEFTRDRAVDQYLRVMLD